MFATINICMVLTNQTYHKQPYFTDFITVSFFKKMKSKKMLNAGNFFHTNSFLRFFISTFAPMNTETDNIIQRIYCLYQKYGIKSITMDDVARELGISKKTIYEHFTDKNDLVNKVYEYEHKFKNQQFDNLFTKGENAIQGLFLVIHFMDEMLKEHNYVVDYDLKKYYPEVFEKKRKRMIEGVYEKIYNNLIRGIKEKLYRSDMDPELIARLHVSRIVSVITSDIFTVEEFTNNNNRRELMIYHIRGIATEKGIKVLEKELQNEKEIKK